MDKRQVALLSVKGAVHEAAFFLDMLLSRYDDFKHETAGSQDSLTEASYMFNAFVRSAKSALEVLGKVSDEGKKAFLERLEGPHGFTYLMQAARNVISHGSGDLLSGNIEAEHDGKKTLVLVCSPLNEGGAKWIKPPNQDSISLALDYFLAVLDQTEKCYAGMGSLPDDYWLGIRNWELEGMKATVHVSPSMIESARRAQLMIPPGFVPDFVDTSWVGSMIEKYANLRMSVYPTILIARGMYHLSFPAYNANGQIIPSS
ncbi:hypothetical protein [Dechloromonas hortensis]|uniref:hypothetical protein n=1 Tax=Dechloromonas hortensis TaxID=337779 RepID=UPI0012929855|nr:hypothetical protein [Dechloromonas hortensis]